MFLDENGVVSKQAVLSKKSSDNRTARYIRLGGLSPLLYVTHHLPHVAGKLWNALAEISSIKVARIIAQECLPDSHIFLTSKTIPRTLLDPNVLSLLIGSGLSPT